MKGVLTCFIFNIFEKSKNALHSVECASTLHQNKCTPDDKIADTNITIPEFQERCNKSDFCAPRCCEEEKAKGNEKREGICKKDSVGVFRCHWQPNGL